VQICYAGDIAERRYNARGVRHYHAESDRHSAIEVLSYVAGSPMEFEAWLKLLYIRTENLLSSPGTWRAVERLAAALVQRRAIPGKEAREIIEAGFNESLYAQHPEMRSAELALAARLKARAQQLKLSVKDRKGHPKT